jgi:endonuclease YncB( thermonuclease family)
VHDGDTITVDVDLGFEIHVVRKNMRFFGYDAPELKTHLTDPDGYGEAARAYLNSWLGQHPGPYTIHTEHDHTEKYWRFLMSALIAADDHELLNEMIAAGWLKPYTGSGPKPIWP